MLKKVRSIFSRTPSPPASQREQSLVNLQMVIDLTRKPNPNLGLPPDAIPGLSVIKALVRGLRYRTVDQLVGRKIELTSIAHASDELRVLVRQHGIELGATITDTAELGFRKYGLLDYEFEVVATQLNAERQSVRFLKEMGFLPDKHEVDDGVFPDAGIGFLEEMLADVKKDRIMLKIMLDSQGSYQGAQGAPQEKWLNFDLSQHFPCEFVIRDACLTNCGLIWLNRHFYL